MRSKLAGPEARYLEHCGVAAAIGRVGKKVARKGGTGRLLSIAYKIFNILRTCE
jgi:hypothetical protein